MLAAGKAKMKAKDLVEFVGLNVESATQILVMLYADVCGAVPGVAPVVSGSLQTYLSLCVVQVLHQLTFWTTYDDLLSQFGIGSNTQKAVSKNTDGTPLGVSAGPYRHHVGQIISYLIKYDFCRFAVTHMSRLTRSLSEPVLDSEPQLREHLTLFKSLLTQTDQFVSALRRIISKYGFLENVCDPLMQALSGQQLLTAEHVALLIQCVDVAATVAFRSSESHRYWNGKKTALLNVVENATVRSAEFDAASGEEMFTELVAQLVRLVVNSQCSAPAAAVHQLWKIHLDEIGKQRVAHRLSNPRSRNRPIDVFTPVYDALRSVFRVDSDAPAVVAEQRLYAKSASREQRRQGCQPTPHTSGWGRNRNRSRGRRRDDDEGRRRRSRSRGGGRPCRWRQSRRQRRKRRFQIFAQHQSQSTELDAASLELLEADDTSGDSSSDDSEEERTKATTASPDLSRWRRGPPPRSVPTRYVCSLCHALIQSTPVLSSAGYIFDEDVILDYLKYYHVCPISGAPLLPSDLVVDTLLKEELNKVRGNFI
ncbi:hypothetical protein ABB37_00973 [Leptomonas pyrrhocoris]|uniref:U-box domain-containing protein n=1 Tax=Leptomonas pyrrhocoris TaxID=157538 RepID=A0A0N0E0Y2_LEPPY|nr:hypothetical protein ABB37_00973 [Leptomonas pyrrhocoris]XP_015665387.1 hypothetical protein ABB37_00973 [Leptomonas pyrrhocoris]XP_015665388.1 hypothetical protein ABB37_00973 [Leptomonas pyrrhocoris]KPA86947.1 hypothetical protein ABB37_00973 [Leptomonas pyrrhocoris]KPA86948.1 hypothetical protein ABB37_00973 [Leptomonas pyrrhocoris]KPA86949.1 hypothetical protein ABB37_00973 [Leptomonas pyrrhocoris]|eukprot:XP_015665386.1 hypothetical protein ABB37_00973 [Leptomonas pyrrhocoris]